MLFSEDKFFAEALDLTVPALRRAADLYAAGDVPGAEGAFVAYLREALRCDLYFRLPYYPRENAWDEPGEDDRAAADRICTGKLRSCGFTWDFGSPDRVDWNSNPTYNGYSEWTWQLSRHHEFRCLGKVYRDTGDEKYAGVYQKLLTSWIEQAPCPENAPGGKTLTWRTIEAGIRMSKNWHYAIHAFLFSPTVTDKTWVLTFRSLWEHAYRLRHFNTQNNWLIMEMSGLFHIGALYPFFREAGEWVDYAFRRLSEEVDTQVYPDDFQFELSTNYHGVVLMNLLFVVDVAKIYGIALPEHLMHGIHRLYRFYGLLVRPDGRLPDLNDGTKPSVSQVLSEALTYFPDDPGFLWFATGGERGKAPDGLTRVLPYSGMVAFRTGYGREDTWAFFESAPFGKAHQHEDKLNFLLYAYGTNMLDDPGNYAYDNSDMRKYILSTRSHNCAMVDGQPQRRRDRYRWDPADITRKSDLRYADTGEFEVAQGEYGDGYGPEHTDVLHRRRVIWFKRGLPGALPFFLIEDTFTARDGKEHCFEPSFQLGAEPLTAKGRQLMVTYATGATLTLTSHICPTVSVAQKCPEYKGWRPIRGATEHEHLPAPVVAFPAWGEHARVYTALYPAPDAVPGILAVAYSEETDSFSLTTGEGVYTFSAADPRFAAQEL